MGQSIFRCLTTQCSELKDKKLEIILIKIQAVNMYLVGSEKMMARKGGGLSEVK